MSEKKKINYNQCGHVLLSYSMSYVEHGIMGIKRKDKQKQCPNCGLWLFPEEKNTDPKYINVIPH